MVGLPPATRLDDVVDVLHGTEVRDPYRWLEHGDDSEVVDWIAAQNRHSTELIESLPDRDRWHARLVELLQLPVVMSARIRNGRAFALERGAEAEQFALTVRTVGAKDDEPTVLVEPAAGTIDAARAIDWFHPNRDATVVAVGISEGGTERSVLRLVGLDTAAGADEIPHTRACSLDWLPDGSGFVYTRYPDGGEYHRSVYRHQLGEPWSGDELIWSDDDDQTAWPEVKVSPDGSTALVHVSRGWTRIDPILVDLATGRRTTLHDHDDVSSSLAFSTAGESLVGLTTLDAPMGRVVMVDLDRPAPEHWRTIAGHGDRVIDETELVGDEIWAVSSRNGVGRIERYGLDGRDLGLVAGIDGAVSIVGLNADPETGDALAIVDSFTAPTTVWLSPANSGTATPWFPRPGSGPGAELGVDHVEYPSEDGTAIGMFVIRRSDVEPGRDVPAILNGYGGFAIAETPLWSAQISAWCEAGGTYAIAQMRGGLEHGEAWHLAGRREHKQNVFDDFHAAADWLVEQQMVDRDRLALHGRSNGGLLVGVALTQRPDLCRAVWCGVPLLDMVRFPQFLIARMWTDEYGDPDIAEEFGWLHKYSPYHNVVAGTCYPATLFTAAEGDSRVDPLHARKMTAAVQAATSCGADSPIVMIQEGRAGHGVGKPVGKRADELADALAFLAFFVGCPAPNDRRGTRPA